MVEIAVLLCALVAWLGAEIGRGRVAGAAAGVRWPWWGDAGALLAGIAAAVWVVGASGGAAWLAAALVGAAAGGVLSSRGGALKTLLILVCAAAAAWVAKVQVGLIVGVLYVALCAGMGGGLAWVLRWKSWQRGALSVAGALVGVFMVLLLVGVVVDGLGGWRGAVGGSAAAQRENDAQSAPAVGKNEDCRCSAAALCEGARGGRYCVDDNGAKRYKSPKNAAAATDSQ